MKKLITLSLLCFSLIAKAQHPQMKVFYVDSAFNNQVATWLLPQVAISGYFENLLHLPTTLSGYGITDGVTSAALTSALAPYATSSFVSGTYVPQNRTITINGNTLDLSANRSWTISAGSGTVTSITPDYGFTSTTPITTTGTIKIDTSNTGLQTKAGISRIVGNRISKTANYTILSSDFPTGKYNTLYVDVDCTGGNITLTMPSASTFANYRIVARKTDNSANVLTLSGVGTDNKIGTQNWAKELISDTSTWTNN